MFPKHHLAELTGSNTEILEDGIRAEPAGEIHEKGRNLLLVTLNADSHNCLRAED